MVQLKQESSHASHFTLLLNKDLKVLVNNRDSQQNPCSRTNSTCKHTRRSVILALIWTMELQKYLTIQFFCSESLLACKIKISTGSAQRMYLSMLSITCILTHKISKNWQSTNTESTKCSCCRNVPERFQKLLLVYHEIIVQWNPKLKMCKIMQDE